eukprot:CAMPEP_0202465542 /NCGR_PEP_ID=MMETSP1360-20130828/65926_1 /ASSEMBLY_ACC=CAM_ASM_000848 /TAXON_ID=515479 /ORGANISM="Licmophora paradoxa, Strain CCMP2313" /LENGTH=84 /DNA_ID=CAMNT_0049089303 /DNA_START=27 /DNA_END=281 /DNA_ORIENTATION=+
MLFSDLNISPEDITVITEVGRPGAAGLLFDTFGMVRQYDDYTHHHVSGQANLEVTPEQEKILEFLTAEEYQKLGPYLMRKEHRK